LQQAYKVLYRKKLALADALIELKKMAEDSAAVNQLLASIELSTRGIIRA
jgi:UDP-N-acetylglucosamine acyltransferase